MVISSSAALLSKQNKFWEILSWDDIQNPSTAVITYLNCSLVTAFSVLVISKNTKGTIINHKETWMVMDEEDKHGLHANENLV